VESETIRPYRTELITPSSWGDLKKNNPPPNIRRRERDTSGEEGEYLGRNFLIKSRLIPLF